MKREHVGALRPAPISPLRDQPGISGGAYRTWIPIRASHAPPSRLPGSRGAGARYPRPGGGPHQPSQCASRPHAGHCEGEMRGEMSTRHESRAAESSQPTAKQLRRLSTPTHAGVGTGLLLSPRLAASSHPVGHSARLNRCDIVLSSNLHTSGAVKHGKPAGHKVHRPRT